MAGCLWLAPCGSTGKRARRIPPLVAATLGFDALTGSIRLGSSPSACIARIQAAASALSGVDPLLGDIPALETLHGYGPALDWAKRLVADLDAWREGRLKWEDISRAYLLSSEPGLGKSTLVRAIAKAAKLPLISTGVSDWMTPSGYLNDVIRSAEDAFARAAAQSPASCSSTKPIASLTGCKWIDVERTIGPRW